ncbi:putative serine/threonine-protein kinase [Apostasia shenzhenica]|uniref:non-specific serine/threonine protein kinase n=1 Tax=Apostasia shenzhenica TaxID=1088818 RepID=A0A2I0B3V4_9ASPA|nr:putative serine/threonine-protein kinase [Apostasia shenzhenica]
MSRRNRCPSTMFFLFLLLLLLLPVLVRPFAASLEAAKNPSYVQCSLHSRCGGLPNVIISYPFRLLQSPDYCGYPGYELNCDENTALTIDLGGQNYTVKNINYDDRLLEVVDSDFLGNSCPHSFTNTTISSTVFDFSLNDSNVTVYLNCSFPLLGDLVQIPCINNLFGTPNSYYKVDKGASSFLDGLMGGCNLTAALPLFDSAANSLKISNSTFADELQQGFGLSWVNSMSWCKDCIDSKGICGYNSTAPAAPTCFCPNNTALGSCPYDGEKAHKSKTGVIIGVSIAGGLILAAIFSFLCFFLFIRWRKKKRSSSNLFDRIVSFQPSSKFDSELGSSVYTPIFTYEELVEATNGFDASKELGDGGFGTVYKGKLRDGRVVAVKRLYENNYRRVEQFMNEVKILSLLRHQNLVTLYGCTSRHSRELLLVYEFVPNGTVADHLHGSRSSESFIPWLIRMTIAIETADALNYLHSVEPQIIHRDVKSCNILLDNGFHVKVGDFGLSRLFPMDATHVSTAPQGTPGYVDPEYHQCYQLTDKSDVYSFGVVLMELISSKPAVDITRRRNEINLATMAITKIKNRELNDFVDPRLGSHSDDGINRMINQVAELAFQCLHSEKEMRPSIKEVLDVLGGIESGALKNGCGREDGDVFTVKEEARLLKNIPPFSPNSVTEVWDSRLTTPNTSG